MHLVEMTAPPLHVHPITTLKTCTCDSGSMSNPIPLCHIFRLSYLLAAATQRRAGGQDLRGSGTVAGDGHVRWFPRGARGARPCTPHSDTENTLFVSITGVVSKILYAVHGVRRMSTKLNERSTQQGGRSFCFSRCRTSRPRATPCRHLGMFPHPAVGAHNINSHHAKINRRTRHNNVLIR